MSSRHTSFFAKLISLSWGILEKGFKGLFVLVTWTSSVFRTFSSETERHPPGGLASSSKKLLNSFSSSTKEAAYRSSQMIPLCFPHHWKYLDKIWRLSKILYRNATVMKLFKHSSGEKTTTLSPGFLMLLHVCMVSGKCSVGDGYITTCKTRKTFLSTLNFDWLYSLDVTYSHLGLLTCNITLLWK